MEENIKTKKIIKKKNQKQTETEMKENIKTKKIIKKKKPKTNIS